MKFKVKPQDFIVQEIIDLPDDGSGAFSICKVEKRDISTLFLQTLLSKKLNLPLNAIIFPALKDKYSVSTQYVSIKGHAPETMDEPEFSLTKICLSKTPLSTKNLRGNNFTIVLRDLTLQDIEQIRLRGQQLNHYGFANFFDKQRFGSYVDGHGFIGKDLLAQQYQAAIEKFMFLNMAGDPQEMREFKTKAKDLQNNWQAILAIAPKSAQKSILVYLKDHPLEYKGACKRINPRLLSIYLSGYQAFLWNKIASQYLINIFKQTNTAYFNFKLIDIDLPVYNQLSQELFDKLKNTMIAMPSKKVSFTDLQLQTIFDQVLIQEGLTMRDLRVRFSDKVFLSPNHRRLIVIPENLILQDLNPDELHPGKQKITLLFTLPSGCFATTLIEGLFASDLG